MNKVSEGRPNVVDMIKNGDVQLVIATADESRTQISDARQIRQTALAQLGVVYYTTISGAAAAVEGQKHAKDVEVRSLQELHAMNRA